MLNTGSVLATTVTDSSTAMFFTVTLTSAVTPRLTVTFSFVYGSKALPLPTYVTVTTYGPPTRMFGMK